MLAIKKLGICSPRSSAFVRRPEARFACRANLATNALSRGLPKAARSIEETSSSTPSIRYCCRLNCSVMFACFLKSMGSPFRRSTYFLIRYAFYKASQGHRTLRRPISRCRTQADVYGMCQGKGNRARVASKPLFWRISLSSSVGIATAMPSSSSSNCIQNSSFEVEEFIGQGSMAVQGGGTKA